MLFKTAKKPGHSEGWGSKAIQIFKNNLKLIIILAHPQSSLAFHWPRLDMDQLLTMKLLDVSGEKIDR